MAVANSQTYAVQMEKVSKKLPELYSLSQGLNRLFKKAPAEKVSSWTAGSGAVLGFRIPIKQYDGGDLRVVSLDDGDLGTGSMPTYQYMTIGYSPLSLSFLLPTLTMMATATAEQATKNVFKDTMDGALKSFAAYEDALAFSDSTGTLATGSGTGASPSGTNPVYNLEPNFGPQRLLIGQLVDVFDTTGVTKKNAAAVRVAAIDPVAKTASLTGTVTSPLNSDIIAVAGLTAVTAGATRQGIYNYNSSATSGSTNGLSRTTVPELVTPNYTAGATLTAIFGLVLSDYRIQRRDEKAQANTMGVSHMAQREAAFNTGDAIAEWQIPGPSIAENLDRIPKNSKESSKFTFAGVEYTVCKRADRSRMDQFNLENYGRVNLAELDYFKTPDGKYVFEDRSSSGTVKTGMFFSLISTENTYSDDPGNAGIISSLTIPPGM